MTAQDNHWSGKDTFIALIVVLIWGVNFVPMKFGLEQLSPLELGAGRYLFATLPLIFFIRFPTVRPRWVIISALFQGIGQFSLLFMSLQVGMTASLASVLLQTQIFFTALWSFLVFRHTPSKLLWLSMASATIGLGFFAGSALQASGAAAITLPGLWLMLGSAAMWGAANLVARQVQSESPHYDALAFIVWSSLVAFVLYLVLIAGFSDEAKHWFEAATWGEITMKTWVSTAYLGWASSVVGYALWTLLIKRHAPNKVAPFSLGVPLVGLTVGLVWLNEPINFLQWCGSAFVGFSLVLVVFGPRWLRR